MEEWLRNPILVSPHIEQTPHNEIKGIALAPALAAIGYTHWFPVQQEIIPRLLETRYSTVARSPGDICVSACTGSVL